MPYLSIVIPAYNEENRIGTTLKGTFDYLDTQAYDAEVIVVDDGSKDRTTQRVLEFQERAQGRLRLVENPGNRGKGYAVRNGMLAAAGEIILFYDADLATPTSEIAKVIEPIAEDRYDVVFGSRALKYELIGTHQSFLRELRGRGGNLFLRAMLGLSFKDTQCGFKAFRKAAARAIFPLQRVEGFGFDPEILFIAQKQGWRLLEMPVRWNHVEGSSVTLFGTTIKVLMEVSAIRWNDLLGRYNDRASAAGARQS
ncbi:MAG: glycosyltransferase family 2 protein [Blastocatellia bacterium]|nr:glycosyltransferase family 2 protein [Blastocatellia bacterium]